MIMQRKPRDLWSLVRGGSPQIDPHDLAEAVVNQVTVEPLDYRTRLLIRDSMEALRNYWGQQKVDQLLEHSPAQTKIGVICRESFEEIGFPSIRMRLMEKLEPETVRLYFAELAKHVRKPMKLEVGGSIAFILPELLVRNTEDVDVVDEVPKDLREKYDVLEGLQNRYGLNLTHFQQHYLPSGWANR